MDDDYELMSHGEASKLRKELSELKNRNPDSAMQEDLGNSIKKLTEHLESMLLVFEEAAEEMRLEDRETEVMAQKIDPLMQKMDELIEQNKKIAKGIVAVADMLNDLKLSKKPEQQVKPAPIAPVMRRPEPFPQQEYPSFREAPMMPEPDFAQQMPSMPPMPKMSPMSQANEGMTFGPPPLPRRSEIGQQIPPMPDRKKFSLFGK